MNPNAGKNGGGCCCIGLLLLILATVVFIMVMLQVFVFGISVGKDIYNVDLFPIKVNVEEGK